MAIRPNHLDRWRHRVQKWHRAIRRNNSIPRSCDKTMVNISPRNLILARKPCFATFAGVGGGVGATPPWRFQTKRRRASRKRPVDCSRRVLAIGDIIFGPRSIFDPVMAGQRSNFRKFHDFSTSRADGIKTIYRSGMKPSPACSPFNFA